MIKKLKKYFLIKRLRINSYNSRIESCYCDTELISYKCIGKDIYTTPAIDGSTDINRKKVKVLPGTLLIKPDYYLFNSQIYDLRADGLYRFYKLGEISEQRIVWTGNIDLLLANIVWLWAYGNVDEKMSLDDIIDELSCRKVALGCGTLSLMIHRLLKMVDIRSRVVSCITNQPWNKYDDGHTMVEIFYDDEGWVLFDPSFKCIFKNDSKKLSLLEFLNTVRNNRYYEIFFFSNGHDISEFRDSDYNYGFWIDHKYYSEAQLRLWYARVANIPLIYDSNYFYFTGNEKEKNKMLLSNNLYLYLPYDEFMRKFYI